MQSLRVSFRQFQGPPSLLGAGLRQKHSKRINAKVQSKVEDPNAIQYFGFKYFPRFPDQKDPPYEPSKLFMVKRIRTLKKLPHWDKDLVKKLGLEDRGNTAIMKNTPIVNAMLYKLKHVLEITPITMPYGMPDSPENGFLKESGEFVAYNSLQGHPQLEEAKTALDNLRKVSTDGPTLKRRLHLKWYSRY